MLTLVLACVVGPGGGVDSGSSRGPGDEDTHVLDTGDPGGADSAADDTGSPSDSGSAFDPAICVLPEDVAPLACELDNPGVVSTEALASLADRLLRLAPTLGYGTWATDWPCSSTTDGVTTSLVGDCSDADGHTWSGSASWTGDGAWTAWVFAALTESTSDGTEHTWDGDWRFLRVDEGYYSRPDLTWTISGSTDASLPDGVLVASGELDAVNGALITEGAVQLDGWDYCLAADVSWAYGCDNLYGWWQIEGDRSAILVEIGRAPDCSCGCWDASDEEPEEFCR